MPDDKAKAITCLILSAVGWLVFIGALLYEILAPYKDEFSSLLPDVIMAISAIAALVIHVVNCILGIVFLLQRTEYKAACIVGLSISIIFIVCCVIFCFFAFWTPPGREEPWPGSTP